MIPPTLLPSAAGPNLQREVTTIQSLLTSPERPFVAIVGGAKVADKLGIVRVLADKAQTVLVGGGMAYTFEVTQGRTIGSSLFDGSHLDECAALLKEGNVLIPEDSRGLKDGQPFGDGGGDDEVIDFGANVPDGFVGLDIGPQAVATFCAAIGEAKTILWNGPMGVFEDPRLSAGTEAVARAVAASSAVSVIGGGDSVAALQSYGLEDQVSFVSTGGGASLELVELGDLPGLRALRESPFNA
jgi:phosphoglycerate kinase